MKYRYIFLAGLGAGFVIGARAGRERYEQLLRLARRVADNPTVQQAAGAAQAQGTGLAKTARDKLVDLVPRIAGSARSRIDDVRRHSPGIRGRSTHGHPESDGHGHYEPAPGSSGGPPQRR